MPYILFVFFFHKAAVLVVLAQGQQIQPSQQPQPQQQYDCSQQCNGYGFNPLCAREGNNFGSFENECYLKNFNCVNKRSKCTYIYYIFHKDNFNTLKVPIVLDRFSLVINPDIMYQHKNTKICMKLVH